MHIVSEMEIYGISSEISNEWYLYELIETESAKVEIHCEKSDERAPFLWVNNSRIVGMHGSIQFQITNCDAPSATS